MTVCRQRCVGRAAHPQGVATISPRSASGRKLCQAILLAGVGLTVAAVASAGDWPAWRGVAQNGVSTEQGLISNWSPEGENLLWRADFTGRSTPVVIGGRVFVIGRGGTPEEKNRNEHVAAFDAETGEQLWQRVISTQLTTVPYNRAGWASLVADRETGYIYAQGIAGPFFCFDRDGNVVWERSLYENDGRFSGYGGRTHTPLIDENRVVVSIINSSWGKLGPPRHRYYAFDKRTGDVLWISTPGGNVYDRNTQSNMVVGVVNGRRLIINGNADGRVYALLSRTGEKVWEFELSKRGLNSTPLLAGTTVYIGHSEENVDEATLGRVVAIDATGTGDVTKTHEKWRRDIAMGFPSPMFHDGRLYVMNNSANLYALNAETGETLWEHSLGTVGKSAPVWADGKIYATEVNGHVHILEPGDKGVTVLDSDQLSVGDRYAELYGSVAIAYGRIYFTTEEGLYCLGDAEKPFEISESAQPPLPAEIAGSSQASRLLVVPGDTTIGLSDRVQFEIFAFNDTGRALGRVDGTWSLDGLEGSVSSDGTLSLSSGGAQAGEVVARYGELEARARVRAFGDLPYSEDFESVQGRGRPYWLGLGRYQVIDQDGGKVLEKPLAPAGLLRSNLLIGPPQLSDYTIEADIMGNQKGRRRTDVALINSGYVLDLQGNSQKLQLASWLAELRMAQTVDYAWEMGVWYHMKLRVERTDGMARVLGKVWKKGDPEPGEWTITADDPFPTTSGAPGVQGYSPASIYYDNVLVTRN